MQELKERIQKEGKVLPGNIVKVDGFLNHRATRNGMACESGLCRFLCGNPEVCVVQPGSVWSP